MEYRIDAYIKDCIAATPVGENMTETFASMLNGGSAFEIMNGACLSVFPKKSKWYGLDVENTIIEMATEIASKNSINYSDSSLLLIISTTKGDIARLEQEEYILATIAESVGKALGCANLPQIVSNACISGVSATIVAKRYIEEGLYKNIVVVGCDRFSKFIYTGFDSFKSLSGEPCRPYDTARCGLNLGEAGACLLISTEGDIKIKGGAITNDANHISGPSRTGDGLFYAIEEAMNEAYGTISHPVDFINAHGTATLYNDEMESKAITLAGMGIQEDNLNPKGVPVNSLKGYIGHTLGASGVVEIALCCKQLKEGVILPTKGFAQLGVPMPINVVKDVAIKIDKSENSRGNYISNCVKTASGFGGCNAAVVLELEDNTSKDKMERVSEQTPLSKYSECTIANGEIILNDNIIFESNSQFAPFIREAYKMFCSPNMKFYKMDDMCKLGYVAAEILLEGEIKEHKPSEHLEKRDTAIILSNDVSSLESDSKHWQTIINGENPSPAIFVYTLPNLVLGEICIRHKIKGENTFFITPNRDKSKIPDTVTRYANILLHKKEIKRVIYGWCSYYDNRYCATFGLFEK